MGIKSTKKTFKLQALKHFKVQRLGRREEISQRKYEGAVSGVGGKQGEFAILEAKERKSYNKNAQ